MVIAKGQSRESMIPSPIMTAMEQRRHRPVRGADPLHQRRAGRADLDPVREVRLHPRAGRRQHRLRPARLLHHRHRQQPRPGRQRPVLGAQAAVQLRPHPGGDQQDAARRRSSGSAPTELLRRHQIELDVPPTLLDILLQSFADLRAAAAVGHQRRREAGVGAVHRRADRRAGGRDPAQPVLRRPHAAGADARRLAGRLAGPAQPGGPGDPQQVLARRRRAAQQGTTAATWPAFLEGGRQAIATLS